MAGDPTSLDGMHDIVIPPSISWWPPAVGWYVVAAVTLIATIAWLIHAGLKWRANAYRRSALSLLEDTDTPLGIATILRRTALAVSPRTNLARLNGPEWAAWLASVCDVPLDESVRQTLIEGPYREQWEPDRVEDLKRYAHQWILRHNVSDATTSRGTAAC